jgi:hypothetical protein
MWGCSKNASRALSRVKCVMQFVVTARAVRHVPIAATLVWTFRFPEKTDGQTAVEEIEFMRLAHFVTLAARSLIAA